jgi:hypothetical protein
MGMSSGSVTLGLIDDSTHPASSIVGHAANQAKQIQATTRSYGGNLIIDERTLERMLRPERFNLRELHRVSSQENGEALRLYEVTEALPDKERIARQANLERYARALRAFRAGNMGLARSNFQACLERDPSDRAAKTFLSQIADLKAAKPSDPVRR